MKPSAVLAGIGLFVAVAFWLNSARHERAGGSEEKKIEARESSPSDAADPETLRSVAYLERYIRRVIVEGSDQGLGFAYGAMPEGMADTDAAPKIAAYVVTLAGLKPSHPEWVKAGRTFYVSNCGGCHGEDGRGIHGTFPDLTRVPLLGIERQIRAALRQRRAD